MTLRNPNLIVQFMGLYQLLMKLLSKGKNNIVQRNVINYFENNRNKYGFITFKQTHKAGKSFKEDIFTYIK